MSKKNADIKGAFSSYSKIPSWSSLEEAKKANVEGTQFRSITRGTNTKWYVKRVRAAPATPSTAKAKESEEDKTKTVKEDIAGGCGGGTHPLDKSQAPKKSRSRKAKFSEDESKAIVLNMLNRLRTQNPTPRNTEATFSKDEAEEIILKMMRELMTNPSPSTTPNPTAR